MRVEDAGRVWRTVRHLRASQVWHRVRLTVRRRLWSRSGGRIDAGYRRRAEASRVRWDHPGLAAFAAGRAARRPPEAARAGAEDALAGRFTLLGETRALGLPVPWDRPDLMQALLWKTHLHEFGFALDLALAARATGEARFRQGFFALARSWCGTEPIGRPGFHRVAWNERVVATRLLHWAAAGALLELRAGDADADWLGREWVRHALFLRDNLALDLLANHLFRDCMALAFADEIAACCPDGSTLFEREVAAQILPDGCHVERSPMYHAVCLEDLVDLHTLLGDAAPDWLRDAVRRAAGFLESVLLGDRDIPLLGDAWRDEVAVEPLLARARAVAGPPLPPREAERWSGLVGLGGGPIRAVIRAGPHGPDHQLGHAHADLLSFDLSAGAHRVVTDTGTSCYAAGAERTRLRSTAAHNTVQIDGEELLEAWSSFRSGRRGRARCHARGESGGFAWLWASHDGYARLAGRPLPHRLLAVGARDVLVLDRVCGSGRHRLATRLLLHPDAPAAALPRIIPLGAASLHSAPLHEHFGETRETRQLVLEADAVLPWLGGFWLRWPAEATLLEAARGLVPEPETPEIEIEDGASAVRVALEDQGARLTVHWSLALPAGADPVRLVLASSS